MSDLTDKYGGIYELAAVMGCYDLDAKEENNTLIYTGTCPSQYVLNQLWDKIKEIDGDDLPSNDMFLQLVLERDDIYGEYEVQPGDSLSRIAKRVTHGKLSYQDIFDANTDILDDPDEIQVGQKLTIPKFD